MVILGSCVFFMSEVSLYQQVSASRERAYSDSAASAPRPASRCLDCTARAFDRPTLFYCSNPLEGGWGCLTS